MKKTVFLLWILFLAGLMIRCKEISPLIPPNPVVGTWQIDHWEMYDLPSWFIAIPKTTEIEITPTDTMTFNGTLASLYTVHSFTFTQDHTFSELYPVPYINNQGELGGQVDKGNWTLVDSVISLSVTNNFPHKLTYSATTDQLYTDRVVQRSVLWLGGDPKDAVTVPYTIRTHYRRSP